MVNEYLMALTMYTAQIYRRTVLLAIEPIEHVSSL
jgi:hypothetical protein